MQTYNSDRGIMIKNTHFKKKIQENLSNLEIY